MASKTELHRLETNLAPQPVEYAVILPPGYDSAGPPLPLCLVLHGGGGSHENLVQDEQAGPGTTLHVGPHQQGPRRPPPIGREADLLYGRHRDTARCIDLVLLGEFSTQSRPEGLAASREAQRPGRCSSTR